MSNYIFRLHCPNCNHELDEQDEICPSCGMDLNAPLTERELELLAEPHLEEARKALESGHHLKAALAKCDQALEYTPESARAHNLRGLVLDALGRTSQAILAYQEAIRIAPDLD